MAFSYDAGTTAPDVAGRCDFPSLRLNDGTFRALELPPLTTSAPVRVAVTALAANDGGIVGARLLDAWQFDITGWLLVDDLGDIQGAIDYLRSKINLAATNATVVYFQAPGWSGRRQMTLTLAGQLVVTEPAKGDKILTERDFTIPVVAADPRLYDETATVTTIGSSTSLTNSGNYPSPITVRFNGPQTNPEIDGPGSAGSNRLRYVGTIASGHYVEVMANPAVAGGITVKDDTGASVYGAMGAFTADTIPVGTSSWTATNDSGAGTTVLTFRNAWA